MKVIHITIKQHSLLESRRADLFVPLAQQPEPKDVQQGEHVLIDSSLYRFMFNETRDGSSMHRFIADNQSFRMSSGLPEHVDSKTLVMIWTDDGQLHTVMRFNDEVHRFYPPSPTAVRGHWERTMLNQHFSGIDQNSAI